MTGRRHREKKRKEGGKPEERGSHGGKLHDRVSGSVAVS